ncbi:TauD/TfdA family dioxygenase [Aeoliella sp. ICT_H6.2]|uniref:TauD/TfdA family dioxygenase n=1 Tax=Aeoliella straminimaris TaxID=2954799 RepID=A0A9X2FA92_9BACT|nr:TauD/TfdA family dioxygenase [Aeoliella straminimaris]MCO6044829.1 TauD/TfdA family dioxygenase [Aeoliella straminimaris]
MSNSTLRPIEIDAAWKGDELLDRPEWDYRFTSEEIDELLTAARQMQIREDTTEVVPDRIGLPRLAPRLEQIQELLEQGAGAVRITGFPGEDVSLDCARCAFWAVSRHIGTPVSQSANGEKIFSVRDAGFASDDKRARGPNTRKPLSFHTDRCDVIGFHCYRQAQSGGENQLVSSVAIYNHLLNQRPDLVEVLMQPYWYQRHNVDTGNAMAFCEQPIFSIHEGYFAASLMRVLIDRAYASGETPEMTPLQREALDTIQQVAESPEFHCTFRQEPGEMLFLNNFVTLHRRTAFTDYSEPDRKRHLLRIWLSVPNSRPLDPRFAANYGATAAGAIRGGMKPAS